MASLSQQSHYAVAVGMADASLFLFENELLHALMCRAASICNARVWQKPIWAIKVFRPSKYRLTSAPPLVCCAWLLQPALEQLMYCDAFALRSFADAC